MLKIYGKISKNLIYRPPVVPGGMVPKTFMLSSKPVLRARSTTIAGQLVGPAQCGGESVQEALQHHHRPSPGSMSTLQDRGDYSSGWGCCQKERGGGEDGEADAGGEEG